MGEESCDLDGLFRETTCFSPKFSVKRNGNLRMYISREEGAKREKGERKFVGKGHSNPKGKVK